MQAGIPVCFLVFACLFSFGESQWCSWPRREVEGAQGCYCITPYLRENSHGECVCADPYERGGTEEHGYLKRGFCACKIGHFAEESYWDASRNEEVIPCEQCGFGLYKSWIGVESCSPCVAGKYSTVLGAVSAESCQNCGVGET